MSLQTLSKHFRNQTDSSLIFVVVVVDRKGLLVSMKLPIIKKTKTKKLSKRTKVQEFILGLIYRPQDGVLQHDLSFRI